MKIMHYTRRVQWTSPVNHLLDYSEGDTFFIPEYNIIFSRNIFKESNSPNYSMSDNEGDLRVARLEVEGKYPYEDFIGPKPNTLKLSDTREFEYDSIEINEVLESVRQRMMNGDFHNKLENVIKRLLKVVGN